MKKLLSLLAWISFAVVTRAQAPGILNYQGVARNSVGNVLINKAISLRLTIHDGSATGPVVYQESRAVVTNPFGLFNIQIGSPGATGVIGTIIGVNWALGNKYLQVEIDPAGGTSYINIGVVQLASVPYALNAAGAMPIGPAGGSLTGIYPNPIIANGAVIQTMIAAGVTLPPSGPAGGDLSGTYPNPSVAKLRGVNINNTTPTLNQLLGFDGTNWTPTALSSHPDNYWRLNGANIFNANSGAVGIGNNNPAASAKLDISSNSAGLLIPRMTEAERNAIGSPATGLMIYQTNNTSGFYFYDGSTWTKFATGASANNLWSANGNKIYNTNTGFVGIGTTDPEANLHIRSIGQMVLALQGLSSNILFLSSAGTTQALIKNNSSDLEIRATQDIDFYTANTRYMSIKQGGNVGIGTASPNYKLTVQNDGPGIVQTNGSISVGTYVNPGGGWFGTFSNNPLHFFTDNGFPQMTILQNGNVGIGTINPSTRFHIVKNDEALRLNGADSYMSFYNGNSYRGFVGATGYDMEFGTPNTNVNGDLVFYTKGVPQFVVHDNGRVRVGPLDCVLPLISGAPRLSIFGSLGIKKDYGNDNVGEWAIAYDGGGPIQFSENVLLFYYNGGVKAWVDDVDGDWETASDKKLKEDFIPYKPVLDGVKKLEVLTYHYKADKTGRRSFGLLAQNLQEHFPELVAGDDKNNEGYLGVSYGKTGVLAIKAIQEQQVMIDELKKENAEIRHQLKQLLELVSKK